ncbi:MAG TPA: lipoprotein insertase outer membrane protein LolB [Xanthomonadales bacterium]|nr:lipoprotein insertase outer membrane protein LolB [Xanthomonadales bacterium]
MMLRFIALVSVAVLLSACSQAPKRTAETPGMLKAYQERETLLTARKDWTLDGRLAIHDGKDGGSGSIIWVQAGSETELRFRGALGQGAWRLQAGETGARIELANGEVHRASSVAELVKQQVGWVIPVEALSWWVRGLAQPGKQESRSLDDQGRLLKLAQAGWEVDFGKYADLYGATVPERITARRGKYLVKLVVRNWTLEAREPLLD